MRMRLLHRLALIVGSLAWRQQTENYKVTIVSVGAGEPPDCFLNGKRVFTGANNKFIGPAYHVEGDGAFRTLYIESHEGAEFSCMREGPPNEDELFQVSTVFGQEMGEDISSQLASNGYPPLEIVVDLTDKGPTAFSGEEATDAPRRWFELETVKRERNVDIECRVGVDPILEEDYGTMDDLPELRVRAATPVRGLDWKVMFEATLDEVVVCRGADLCEASRRVYGDKKGSVETRCDDKRGRNIFSFMVKLVGKPQPATPLAVAEGERCFKLRLNSHGWGRKLPIQCVERVGKGELEVIYNSFTKQHSARVTDLKQPDTSRPPWFEFTLTGKPKANITCFSGGESLTVTFDFDGHQKWHETPQVRDFNVLVSKC